MKCLTILAAALLLPTPAVRAVTAAKSVWFLDLNSANINSLVSNKTHVRANSGIIGQFTREQINTLSTGDEKYTVGVQAPNLAKWWDGLKPSIPPVSPADIFEHAFSSHDNELLLGLNDTEDMGRVVLTLDLESRDYDNKPGYAAGQAAAILWAARKQIPNIPLWPVMGSSFAVGVSVKGGENPLSDPNSQSYSDFMEVVDKLDVSTPFATAHIKDFPSFLWHNGLVDGIVSEEYARKNGTLPYLEDHPGEGKAYTASFNYVVMTSNEPEFLPRNGHTSDYCNSTPPVRTWPGNRIHVDWQAAAYFPNDAWTLSHRNQAESLVPNAVCPSPMQLLAVPEPTTGLLALLALTNAGGYRRRFKTPITGGQTHHSCGFSAPVAKAGDFS